MVCESQALESAVALRRQHDLHPAPVHCIRLSLDQSFGFEPIDQTDGAVVLDQQLPGKSLDSDRVASRAAPDREQRLILPRCEADGARGRFNSSRVTSSVFAVGWARSLLFSVDCDAGKSKASGPSCHKMIARSIVF